MELVLARWFKFNTVGALGVVVQLLVLALLTHLSTLHYLMATALAVEAAVLHNFFWHEQWTWKDRPSRSPTRLLLRLIQFNLSAGASSLTGNLILMGVLVGRWGLPILPANLLTIAACSLFNFLVSNTVIFRNRG